ncbi:MAG: hypothetical protein IKS03_03270 [Ruminococcus sp.]|nr:hypothetical protein [Ruminococcus sp.]
MREMVIICKNSSTKGIINFFAEDSTQSYFLFQQKFRHSTYDFYKKGIPVRQAFSHRSTHRDRAIENVIKRLPSQISYIEKEYGVAILNRTKAKKSA